MRVQTKGSGLCKLTVEDEMTIYTAVKLKETLMEHLQRCSELEIDLSQVDEMDTAGFQLLLLAKREAMQANKALCLVSHSRATLEVLDLYNMAAYFGDPLVLSEQGGTKETRP